MPTVQPGNGVYYTIDSSERATRRRGLPRALSTRFTVGQERRFLSVCVIPCFILPRGASRVLFPVLYSREGSPMSVIPCFILPRGVSHGGLFPVLYSREGSPLGGLFPVLCPEESLPWVALMVFYVPKRVSPGWFIPVLCPKRTLPGWFIPCLCPKDASLVPPWYARLPYPGPSNPRIYASSSLPVPVYTPVPLPR